jgi:hypothetical protein
MDNSYSENSVRPPATVPFRSDIPQCFADPEHHILQQFRSSTMTGLRQPTRYAATAPSLALNEISDSQANARAAVAMPPPPHGLKRHNTDYREPCPSASMSGGIPRLVTDRVSPTEAAPPDAKRKPPSLVERAGEYKPKSQLPPPKVSTAVATKATSIVSLTVSTSILRDPACLSIPMRWRFLPYNDEQTIASSAAGTS